MKEGIHYLRSRAGFFFQSPARSEGMRRRRRRCCRRLPDSHFLCLLRMGEAGQGKKPPCADFLIFSRPSSQRASSFPNYCPARACARAAPVSTEPKRARPNSFCQTPSPRSASKLRMRLTARRPVSFQARAMLNLSRFQPLAIRQPGRERGRSARHPAVQPGFPSGNCLFLLFSCCM